MRNGQHQCRTRDRSQLNPFHTSPQLSRSSWNTFTFSAPAFAFSKKHFMILSPFCQEGPFTLYATLTFSSGIRLEVFIYTFSFLLKLISGGFLRESVSSQAGPRRVLLYFYIFLPHCSWAVGMLSPFARREQRGKVW